MYFYIMRAFRQQQHLFVSFSGLSHLLVEFLMENRQACSTYLVYWIQSIIVWEAISNLQQ